MRKKTLFSQRYGYIKVDDKIQTNDINKITRIRIWNFIYDFILTIKLRNGENDIFMEKIYSDFLYERVDEIPLLVEDKKERIEEIIFKYPWYKTYDFLEFLYGYIKFFEKDETFAQTFQFCINNILSEENAGYRFIANIISPITQKEEIETIEKAINDSNDNGIQSHLQKALEFLSDKKNPDYRNSIKESISAVGVYCRKVTKESTLDKAIIKLKNQGFVFPKIFEEAIKKLYFFTNGKDGIRHELMDESIIDKEEAYFMLIACSNFINYLKIKETKIKQ